MEIMYIVKQNVRTYEVDKYFTFGKTYDVIADYTKRTSAQRIDDSGYVVKDNRGVDNMLFSHQTTVIDNKKDNTYIFDAV